MYVSKFHPNTSFYDIANHMIAETNFRNYDYTVTNKRTLKSKRLSLASFKVLSKNQNVSAKNSMQNSILTTNDRQFEDRLGIPV